MQNRSITAHCRSFRAYSFLSTLAARPQEIRYVTIHRQCRLISFFPQSRAARGNDTTHLFYKVALELFSPLFSYAPQKTLKCAALVAQCLWCDWGSSLFSLVTGGLLLITSKTHPWSFIKSACLLGPLSHVAPALIQVQADLSSSVTWMQMAWLKCLNTCFARVEPMLPEANNMASWRGIWQCSTGGQILIEAIMDTD